MKLGTDYSLLEFLNETECDGTIYISCDKELMVGSDLYEHKEKVSKSEIKRWILQKFTQSKPLLNVLVFGKKTKYDKLRVRLSEEADFYEISFNFWELIEFQPQDEYAAMEQIIELVVQLRNYLSNKQKIQVSFRAQDSICEFRFIHFVDGEMVGNLDHLTAWVDRKECAQSFLYTIIRSARIRGGNPCFKVSFDGV